VVEAIGAAIYFVSPSGFCWLPVACEKKIGVSPRWRASRAAFAMASSIGDGLLPHWGMMYRSDTGVLEIGSCFPLMDGLQASMIARAAGEMSGNASSVRPRVTAVGDLSCYRTTFCLAPSDLPTALRWAGRELHLA
jgi:hypothetical protein